MGVVFLGDYSYFGSCVLCMYVNLVENLLVFVLLVIMVMFVSVDLRLINILVMVYVVVWILYWFVYYVGLGVVGGGFCMLIYVIGWGINVVIGVIVLMVVFS